MSTKKSASGRLVWSQSIVIALSVGVLLITIIGLTSSNLNIRPFAARANAYALPSVAAIITSSVVLFAVTRIRNKTDDLLWYGAQAALLVLLGVAELFTRIGADAHTAVFWWPISSAATYFCSATAFMFVLSYVHPKNARHMGTIVTVLGTTLLLTLVDTRTTLFNQYFDSAVIPAPWGGIVKPGPYYGLLTIWVLGLYSLSLAMLVRLWRTALEPRLRHQARLFCLAMSLPMIVGTFTDGVLPVVGVTNVLPLAVLLTAAMNVIILYGVLKYRMFELTPALVAASILDTMNEAVVGVGPDFAIRYVNMGAERMLGLSYDQFKNRNFSEFLSEQWAPETLRKTLLAPLDKATSNDLDSVDLRAANGSIITAKLSISKVDETDNSQGYLVVITDMTKIAQATDIIEHEVEVRTREVQEAKATLVTSINSLELGFVITNARLKVIRVNTVAHALFCKHSRGHTAGECREIELADVQKLLGPDVKLNNDIQTTLQRQSPINLQNITFDNRDWHVSLSPMVVAKRSIGCVILLEDITEQRSLERSRDEFFSIASHELRTPLTSIRGNSSMILDFYREAIKDKQLHQMMSDIHESSERLISIVNDFLDVSRVEQGRIGYQIQELDVSKTVREVTDDMMNLFKDKKLSLKLGPGILNKGGLPMILADKNRLKQILFNLLGNAIKFTDKGTVTVDAKLGRGVVKIEVQDTGVGIAPAQRPLLFHKLQQAGESLLTRDTTRGTGLGLYISRLLAQGMGGNLALSKSEPGKGSTFVLTLQVSTPDRLKQVQKTNVVVDSKTGLLVAKQN